MEIRRQLGDSGNQTQVTRLGNRYLSQQSHLAGPILSCCMLIPRSSDPGIRFCDKDGVGCGIPVGESQHENSIKVLSGAPGTAGTVPFKKKITKVAKKVLDISLHHVEKVAFICYLRQLSM